MSEKAMYNECGWTAEVEILEDKSNDIWERYDLRVIKTIMSNGYEPKEGHEFHVSAQRKYKSYIGWDLTLIKERGAE